MKNKESLLKVALLSTCFVSASLNAITGNIPEIAKAFPSLPLTTVELLMTIPSLFQMFGVLGGKGIAKGIGYKNTMLLGLLLCGVGGVLPIFWHPFALLMITRCMFGFGAGLMLSTILVLIVYFFEGQTRSTMIGLNRGISGLGSALATFTAGQLLRFGWNISFAVYFLAFLVLALFFFGVPNVRSVSARYASADEGKKQERPPFIKLLGLGLLMFVSVLLATMYVIKASTLITESGFGTAKEGSLAITWLSLGSFTAGLTYGKIRGKIGEISLSIFFLICAAGFLCGMFAKSLVPVWIGAFLLGYGYLGFMPFIQEQASRNYAAYGETATNLVLIFQSVGAFATPYLSSFFGLFTSELKIQFLITAICYGLMAVPAALVYRHKKGATQ